jgi:rod shape determining protein RodA
MRARTRTTIDWMTFSIYLGLTGIGWLMIYTVGYDDGYSTDMSEFFKTAVGKQTIWIGVSFAVLLVTLIIDEKFWRTFAYLAYMVSMLGLALVLVFGKTIKGATSWFNIAGFTLQPSEFAKVGTCLAVAAFLNTYSTNLKQFRSQFIAVGIIAIPILLILLQPDAGSALVFLSFFIVYYREGFSASFLALCIGAVTLLLLGLVNNTAVILTWLVLISAVVLVTDLKKRWPWIIGIIVIALGCYGGIQQGLTWQVLLGAVAIFIPLSVVQYRNRKNWMVTLLWLGLIVSGALTLTANFGYNNLLGNHQQERIKVWLKFSECDPLGAGYNLVQSKRAIGSGRLYGKGFTDGNLTQGHFVPEQSTDFIFCAVGEEQGFIGSFGVIVLFLLLLLRLVTIAERQRTGFARNYAYGLAGIIFIHVLINIGMTMGVMPIIGIPLPFISKGGSSLLGFTIMLGIMMKMDSTRFVG